jgi:Ser-tRNA(Ala) deacylase AlaX
LTNKDKLDEDFNKFNLDIEQATEKELNRLYEEINALKEKADKISVELLSPSSNEEKRS